MVDDGQWADQSSLEFLAYLMRRVGDSQITVILTFRTGEFRSAPAVDAGTVRTAIRPDDSAAGAVQGWAKQVLESVLPDRDVEDVTQWWAQSGGVPLFLLEAPGTTARAVARRRQIRSFDWCRDAWIVLQKMLDQWLTA